MHLTMRDANALAERLGVPLSELATDWRKDQQQYRGIPVTPSPYDSLLERRYADWLAGLVLVGEIGSWLYVAKLPKYKIDLPGGATYQPDFAVAARGRVYLDEVKGYVRRYVPLTLRAAAARRPSYTLRLVTYVKKQGWRYRGFGRNGIVKLDAKGYVVDTIGEYSP